MFDLSAMDGLARTRYILDASCVSAATLAGLTATTGAGAVSLGALTTPGGRITLSTSAAVDTATLTLPISFGNVSGSIAAWSLEAVDLRTAGKRGSVDLGFLTTNGASFNGLSWTDLGIDLASTATPSPARLQAGNFQDMTGVRAGVMVDVQSGSSATAKSQGYLGGTLIAQGPGVSAAGTWTARLRVAGSTASPSTSISVRQLILTCIWSTTGPALDKVL